MHIKLILNGKNQHKLRLCMLDQPKKIEGYLKSKRSYYLLNGITTIDID